MRQIPKQVTTNLRIRPGHPLYYLEMKHNLTETHIAGIAAGVLAIVIIVVAVVLMSVAKPPDPGGNSTFSPTVETTETTAPTTIESEITLTSSTTEKTSTTTSTSTPTPTPTPTTSEPDVNEGIDTSKVSVEPQCTDTENGTATYLIKNNNAKTATIQYNSTTGSGESGTIDIPGGASVEFNISMMGNNTALVIEFPGVDDSVHAGKEYAPASESCGDDETPTPTPPSPNITFANQTAEDGKKVTIENGTAPDGGFIVLSTASDRQAGVSKYLSPGTHTDVSVSLRKKLEEETQITATVYNDTNGNKKFDGGDTAYTDEEGPVSDTATVKVDSGWL